MNRSRRVSHKNKITLKYVRILYKIIKSANKAHYDRILEGELSNYNGDFEGFAGRYND